MDIQLETPALLFSATSLILLAYTNRFLTIATIVRSLRKEFDSDRDRGIILQIQNLKRRLNLIKWMQMEGVISLFLSVVAMLLIYLEYASAGAVFFGLSLLLLLISLVTSATEIALSTRALEIELDNLGEETAQRSKLIPFGRRRKK